MGFTGAVRNRDDPAHRERHGGASRVPVEGTSAARTLRARSRESLQRDQSARVAEGANHKRTARSRQYRSRFGASEHVDCTGGKRRTNRARENDGTYREFSGANRARRAGGRRHVGKRKDKARQGGTEHHDFAGGTGTSDSTNKSSHPHIGDR